MKLAELQKFVWQKFGLRFQPIRPGALSLQVLHAPGNDAWFAALSHFHVKQSALWALDLKCGQFAATIRDLPGFTAAYRLHDPDWVGILLKQGDQRAIKEALTYAFNLAAKQDPAPGISQYFLLPAGHEAHDYQAQQLNFAGRHFKPHHQKIPPALQKMLAAYDYTLLPAKGRAKNFYRQGQLMADYSDDYDQSVSCLRYYPVYHDLSVPQLRTYFAWRTRLRAGKLTKCSLSYAYLYLYELLNSIGVDSPEQGYQKLQEFSEHAASKFDDKLQARLQTWQQDYVIYHHLEKHRQIFQAQQKRDQAYQVLLKPKQATDQQIAAALLSLGSYSIRPAVQTHPDFDKILAAIWKQLRQTDFFFQKIGRKLVTQHQLFAGAVFYERQVKKISFVIDDQRRWQGEGTNCCLLSIEPAARQLQHINLLLHEIDRSLRQYWQLGHPLKARALAPAYRQAIQAGIQAYQHDKNKVSLDLSQLAQIRSDAAVTRESLLTEEEKADSQPPEPKSKPKPQPKPEPHPAAAVNSHGLSAAELQFLLALLQGQPWQAQLRQQHLMATLVVDQINAKLFDQIGDNVIGFDDHNQPQIIADYRPDLDQLFLKEH